MSALSLDTYSRNQYISDRWIHIQRIEFQLQCFDFFFKIEICIYCELSDMNLMVTDILLKA
jgi:hypothetical protein